MADKRELASIFAEIAVLLELKSENPFKIRAYQTAAHIIEQLETELADFAASGAMAETKGIGEAIGHKIQEYIATGRIAYYDELKAAVPAVLFELVKIPGLGPKKALLVHEKLGINSIGELEYACHENRLVELAGFGSKTQEKILQGIAYVKAAQGHFLLADAWPLAEKIAEYLAQQTGVSNAGVAGSIRRRTETVKNIDIVLAGPDPAALAPLVTGMPGIRNIVSQGPAKVSAILVTGMQMDVRLVGPGEFAAALQHFTGSVEHNIKLRRLAQAKKIKISEHGVETAAGQKLPVSDEPELYRIFGLPYIAPELREGNEEIEAAAAGRLPELVNESDIKGVCHIHTTYSDGSATLSELRAEASQRGWGYLGITDHSRTAVYARGLKLESVLEQRREIDRLNSARSGCTLLAGIESDILPDGSLDYPDEILAQFDFVVASVHSAFRQSQADMTRRITRAISNRYVSILGHPTGRILLARDSYALDMTAVIQAAAATGTIIEINASPYRLDLDWRWCRQAKDAGVLLAVNPDAHSIGELDYIRYGIAAARKGWLTASDIVNTRAMEQTLALLRRKR